MKKLKYESFQSFLYWNFKTSSHYKQMLPSSHQPARLKTNKLENTNYITIDSLKLRPIINYTRTLYYKKEKMIGEYLKPLNN